MDWNPLSVIGSALSDEYIGLIPAILSQKSETNLKSFLKEIMSRNYGVLYTESDLNEIEEFELVVKKISHILGIENSR